MFHNRVTVLAPIFFRNSLASYLIISLPQSDYMPMMLFSIEPFNQKKIVTISSRNAEKSGQYMISNIQKVTIIISLFLYY